ncbi:MAG: ATP-grasp domain-containing protein [Muribaculum sp.]|nr:ATP-grasp domain-containing protein [Muribaculum sp.]
METIKKVMVLAGGNDQIELIKGIRKRFPKAEVILIDMNPNVRAKEFADRMLVISTMDFDRVLEAAKDENIDLILSACGDQPMRTMAYVSEELNLPCYITYQQSLNLTNKVLMKQLMLDGGIPTSKFRRFDVNSEIDIEGLKFPLVIKPADNNGSKGIIKVFSKDEFDKAITEAKRFTLSGDLLVEEFKSGEEYSIEAFIKDGEPNIVFASKNIKIKNRNTFTICRNEYVGALSENLENKIKEIVARIGKVFEIDNVPLLIQMIVNGDEVNVIEFSARTGGGSKLFFIRQMVGVDIIDNLLDITFGNDPDITPTPSNDKAAILYAYANPGKFTAIGNLDGLLENGTITEFYQYKIFGSQILSSNYSSDRPLGFLLRGKDEKELSDKVATVNETIQILDDNGNDIMCHEIFR